MVQLLIYVFEDIEDDLYLASGLGFVLFDGFDGDLYGKTISVYFDDRIRDVTKFSSADALRRQLEKDIEVIR